MSVGTGTRSLCSRLEPQGRYTLVMPGSLEQAPGLCAVDWNHRVGLPGHARSEQAPGLCAVDWNHRVGLPDHARSVRTGTWSLCSRLEPQGHARSVRTGTRSLCSRLEPSASQLGSHGAAMLTCAAGVCVSCQVSQNRHPVSVQ